MEYIAPSAELTLRYEGFLKVLCKEVNSVISKKVGRELNRNVFRFDRVPEIDFSDYTDEASLIKDRLVLGLTTKWPGLASDKDPSDECLKTYYKFEEQCRDTNLRFESGQLAEPDVEAVIFIAREKIFNLLGVLPQVKDLPFTFGPGASRNVRRRTSAYHKIVAEPECTFEAQNAALRLIKSVPSLWTFWGGTDKVCPRLKIVRGSRFGQVPKSAKTNRPIDIEPTLNGVLQRGYGSVIKNRLGRAGNCIRSGQYRHSMLAWEASSTKKLATIDKSGASDSIATHLVLKLLPPDWFNALDACRSHYHTINDKVEYLEKFSAMGNGFTFELETVIFLCLAKACRDYLNLTGPVSVYGDDLICPSGIVDLYKKVCDFCGFSINMEKSFWGDVDFRESCGADWFNATDVRVAYMRHHASPHYLSTLHNRMHELGLNHLVPKSFATLREIIPERFRIYGPPSDHRYGYLFEDGAPSCMAIALRPNKVTPSGVPAAAYALYTTQFLAAQEIDSSDPFNQCAQGYIDFTNWKGSLDLSRLSTRNDFKLARRLINFDGTLPAKPKRFSKKQRANWGRFKAVSGQIGHTPAELFTLFDSTVRWARNYRVNDMQERVPVT
jgi:hypothetical protein